MLILYIYLLSSLTLCFCLYAEQTVHVRRVGDSIRGQYCWDTGFFFWIADMLDLGAGGLMLRENYLLCCCWRPWGHIHWSQQGFVGLWSGYEGYEGYEESFFSALTGLCVWKALLCLQTGFRHFIHGKIGEDVSQQKPASISELLDFFNCSFRFLDTCGIIFKYEHCLMNDVYNYYK